MVLFHPHEPITDYDLDMLGAKPFIMLWRLNIYTFRIDIIMNIPMV